MRRGSPTLDTSELLHMLPSAKHVNSMRAKASARASILVASPTPHTLNPSPNHHCHHQASQPNPFRRTHNATCDVLPSIHATPSSPPLNAPSSPGAADGGGGSLLQQSSPSPTRSSLMRAVKKKAE